MASLRKNRISVEVSDNGTIVHGILERQQLLLSGAGKADVGRPLAAVMWFIVVSLGYLLILRACFLRLMSTISAADSAHRLNSNIARMQLQTG